MKKVLKGTSRFRVLGLKQHTLALAVCLGVGFASMTLAEAAPSRNSNPPALKANAPNVYVVKKGDTLWDISKKFLKNPLRWREIWASNKHVKNPHWIFPGDRLLMCSYNGKPLLGKDEGDGCDGIIRRHTGSINLKPRVRVEEMNQAISVIPLSQIRKWIDNSIIVNPTSVENLPYVLGAADQRVLAAEGQTIYVRGAGLEVGENYAVYEKGQPYTFVDAQGKKYDVGLELTQVASGVATAIENDITTIELTKTLNKEVNQGDLIFPDMKYVLPDAFYPVGATDVTPNGTVVRVQGSIGMAAQHSVVTIDRGIADGVKSGQVFEVNQVGQIVNDPKTNQKIQLPSQRIGLIMVFKAFDRLSYAYVLESQLPINEGAYLTPPTMLD